VEAMMSDTAQEAFDALSQYLAQAAQAVERWENTDREEEARRAELLTGLATAAALGMIAKALLHPRT
jgi:hypothetical protein